MVETKLTNNDYYKLDWTLDQTVSVAEYVFPSPTAVITKLLAEMGGSLGLWLGVGIIQLFLYVWNFVNIEKLWYKS